MSLIILRLLGQRLQGLSKGHDPQAAPALEIRARRVRLSRPRWAAIVSPLAEDALEVSGDALQDDS